MPVVHENVRCPRCLSRGARELSSLPVEHHAVYMCPFCKHTWCEAGRRYEPSLSLATPASPSGSAPGDHSVTTGDGSLEANASRIRHAIDRREYTLELGRYQQQLAAEPAHPSR